MYLRKKRMSMKIEGHILGFSLFLLLTSQATLGQNTGSCKAVFDKDIAIAGNTQSPIETFFDNPPEINIAKYMYSEIEIKEMLKQDEIEKSDLNFTFTQSYKRMVEEVQRIPCKSILCKSLTIDERIAMYSYTTQFFSLINPVLRGDSIKDKKAIEPLVSAVSLVLNKLEIFNSTVYRGLKSATHLDKYQIGETITELAYSSSTENKNLDFSKMPVLLIIKSKKGRRLDELSGHPEEEEVLFDRGSKFKIMKRAQHDEQLIVELEEI
jgi:hypothetical protein